MRVHLDAEKCQGHNRCYALAPELFDVDDYGQAMLMVEGEVPAELHDKAAMLKSFAARSHKAKAEALAVLQADAAKVETALKDEQQALAAALRHDSDDDEDDEAPAPVESSSSSMPADAPPKFLPPSHLADKRPS